MVFGLSCYWRLRDRDTTLGDWSADHAVPNHLPKSSFLDPDAYPIYLRHRLANRMGILASEGELIRETVVAFGRRRDLPRRFEGGAMD